MSRPGGDKQMASKEIRILCVHGLGDHRQSDWAQRWEQAVRSSFPVTEALSLDFRFVTYDDIFEKTKISFAESHCVGRSPQIHRALPWYGWNSKIFGERKKEAFCGPKAKFLSTTRKSYATWLVFQEVEANPPNS